MRSVVTDMLKDAGLDGFFTNHSLRRTAATRLFRAGKNVKLIKEITGHVSNAVEKYEVTSDEQRIELSSILQCEGECSNGAVTEKEVENTDFSKNITVESGDIEAPKSIANVIESVIKTTGGRKCRMTIQIDML